MSINKGHVLDVLADLRIRFIRFQAGPIKVNVDEYNRVADFIDSGAIKIKATKGTKHYVPKENTLYLRERDAGHDDNIRSGILHECTHIISDINKVKVSRLHDEAAAYLAEFAFLKLLDPSYEVFGIRGDPLNELIRLSLRLVSQYRLGQTAGFGAIISSSDIDALGRLVQRNPDYSNIKIDEQLTADGVGLTDEQKAKHKANELARLADKTKYEDWLLSTVNAARTGDAAQKTSAYAQLRNHFFMVYQPIATELLQRLSSVNMGDPLSERFAALTPQEKHVLLDALRVPKPPG